jgi:Ser/Thr protein kinase RdoA (MazF antagonist)
MTLRLVLAAYGLENVRPYRIDAGRNNEHWYVGAGLVLRRYGPFRSDAAIDYEHAIVGQLRERGWPVAVPIPSDAGRMVVVDDGRRYSLFPRLVGRRGGRDSLGSLVGFWAGCTATSPLSRSRGHRMPFRRFLRCPPTRPGSVSTPWTTRS